MNDLPQDPKTWSVHDTCQWLQSQGFEESIQVFVDQEVDGEVLFKLTDHMVGVLFPSMKKQLRFFEARQELLSNNGASNDDRVDPLPQPERDIQEVTWHSRYSLPAFPPHVVSALEKKDLLFKAKGRSTIRSSLIQVLYDDICRVTLYPTHKMYTDVLDALCTKYRFLRDASSTGYATILESLRNKFKKERVPLVQVDAVKYAKDKFGMKGSGRKMKNDEVESALVKRRRIDVVGEDEGEDAHSISQHEKAMAKEMEKARPNHAVLKDLMSRTVVHRSTKIQNMDTADIVEMCPYLVIPSLLQHEMFLRFRVSCDSALRQSLTELKDNILRMGRKRPHGKIFQETIDEELEEVKKIGQQKSAAVLMLPGLFGEREDLLYSVDKEAVASSPTLVLRRCPNGNALNFQEMCVMMDGINIAKDDHDMDIIGGIASLFSSYFVYGIEYPKRLKNTLSFVEQFLMGMKQTKPAVAVVRMHSSLTNK